MKAKRKDCYYVCELAFTHPDPRRPSISAHEMDFYAYIPASAIKKYAMHTHRLSLRKNMQTGQFEVYRFYPNNRTIITVRDTAKDKPIYDVTNDDITSVRQEGSAEEIVFSGSFEEALKAGDNEDAKIWAGVFSTQERTEHVPCRHEYPTISLICPEELKKNERFR